MRVSISGPKQFHVAAAALLFVGALTAVINGFNVAGSFLALGAIMAAVHAKAVSVGILE